jgi:hypothetical protein
LVFGRNRADYSERATNCNAAGLGWRSQNAADLSTLASVPSPR